MQILGIFNCKIISWAKPSKLGVCLGIGNDQIISWAKPSKLSLYVGD